MAEIVEQLQEREAAQVDFNDFFFVFILENVNPCMNPCV